MPDSQSWTLRSCKKYHIWSLSMWSYFVRTASNITSVVCKLRTSAFPLPEGAQVWGEHHCSMNMWKATDLVYLPTLLWLAAMHTHAFFSGLYARLYPPLPHSFYPVIPTASPPILCTPSLCKAQPPSASALPVPLLVWYKKVWKLLAIWRTDFFASSFKLMSLNRGQYQDRCPNAVSLSFWSLLCALNHSSLKCRQMFRDNTAWFISISVNGRQMSFMFWCKPCPCMEFRATSQRLKG